MKKIINIGITGHRDIVVSDVLRDDIVRFFYYNFLLYLEKDSFLIFSRSSLNS
jgi:hypothetical protein